MRPDPLPVHAHAVRAGDERLAGLIAARLYPRAHRHSRPPGTPRGAQRALVRLERLLRI